MFEVMACGVPVITTDNGGIRELLEGSVGLIVPERDMPALTAKARKRIES